MKVRDFLPGPESEKSRCPAKSLNATGLLSFSGHTKLPFSSERNKIEDESLPHLIRNGVETPLLRPCGDHAVPPRLLPLILGILLSSESELFQEATEADLLESQTHHGGPDGNWSIEVLGRALRSRDLDMQMVVPTAVSTIQSMLQGTRGVLCGSGAHYSCYIQHNARAWRLDSACSSIHWAARPIDQEIFPQGYRFFRVVEWAPDEFRSESQRVRAEVQRLREHGPRDGGPFFGGACVFLQNLCCPTSFSSGPLFSTS